MDKYIHLASGPHAHAANLIGALLVVFCLAVLILYIRDHLR